MSESKRASKAKLCLREFVIETKKELRNSIIAMVYTGSGVEKESFLEGWSDLDIFVVVETVTWEILRKIHKINNRLTKKYGIHLGTAVISNGEYDSLKLVDNCFKTLLMKQGLITGRSKVIFGRHPQNGIPDLRKKKNIFIREFSFFKAYMRNGVRDLKGSSLLQRCIKCADYIILSALLYEGVLPKNREEDIEELKKRFRDFLPGFEFFEKTLVLKKNFGRPGINYEEESKKIVNFVEQFVTYFYKRNIYV